MDIGSVREKSRQSELVETVDDSHSEEALRAQVEAALRDSEKKYRTLFDSIDNAITVLEVLYDDRGVASDLRFVESNHFFEKQTGLRNHLGKTTSELLPNLDDSCIQAYASVAETGESIRFESYSHDFGRWITILLREWAAKAAAWLMRSSTTSPSGSRPRRICARGKNGKPIC